MIRYIDNLLNSITMYRLVLYELIALLVVAGILGAFGLVPISPLYLAYSVAFIFILAWVVNAVFAYFFDAPSNPESTYITALILALVISPPQTFLDPQFLALAGWATAWAMASKYIFAIRQKHIFNPAAFGIAATALFLNLSASWWVGTLWMLPFVAVGGFLVARKIHRLDLVFAFGASTVATILLLSMGEGSGALHIVEESLYYAPAVFLGTVMLTEPLTTPPTRFLRVWYGILVGFLFAPEVHLGTFYFTPELALLAGNLFAYAVSPKVKLLLSLKERIQLTPDTYEFVFHSDRRLKFAPGQYLEWTLPHAKRDSRGMRRYFTIASSPNDPDVRIGVKFYKPTSSFKKALLDMSTGERMVASQLAGDFIMPSNPRKKLVFMAGGIGVTPFRSMLQSLVEKNEKRDIVVIYVNKTYDDFAYTETLDEANEQLGIKVIPVFTNVPASDATHHFPKAVDANLIRSMIPDYQDRTFYLSGPRGMVEAYEDILTSLDMPRRKIKKDFFPGLA